MAYLFSMVGIAILCMIWPLTWTTLVIGIVIMFTMAYQDGSIGMFLFGLYTAACLLVSIYVTRCRVKPLGKGD